MSNYFKIPLSSEPQAFAISLDGRSIGITCRWNDQPDSGWFIDLYENDSPLVMNLPFTVGNDLLEQYPELGFLGALVVIPDNGLAAPTYDNLGDTVNLYYVTQ